MDDAREALFAVILIFIVLFLAYLFSVIECNSKWGSFDAKYKVIGGCQIKMDGKFIPADSYYYKEGK